MLMILIQIDYIFFSRLWQHLFFITTCIYNDTLHNKYLLTKISYLIDNIC